MWQQRGGPHGSSKSRVAGAAASFTVGAWIVVCGLLKRYSGVVRRTLVSEMGEGGESMDYNARVELDSRNFDEAAVYLLTDALEPYSGTVARAVHGGRVELMLTLPAKDLRQAVMTAISITLSTGFSPYALEVVPTDDFRQRITGAPVPELLSVPQTAQEFGVSRQRVLQLVNAGEIAAVKVGDTWAVPRSAVAARAAELAARTGLRWSGTVVPYGAYADGGQFIWRDALKSYGPLLPLLNEDDAVIGNISSLSDEPEGLSGSGVVRGLTPGEYAIAPHIAQVKAIKEGNGTRRITSGILVGATVLPINGRPHSVPCARITVSEARGSLRTDVPLSDEQVQVLTYP